MTVKTDKELQIMREGGKILRHILRELSHHSIAGTNLLDLDSMAKDLAAKSDALCTFKGYREFPGYICTSINDEVVHGIPRNITLQDGDILSLDLGITYRGFITDCATTVSIGHVPERTRHFLNVVQETLMQTIKNIHEGVYVGDIGYMIQKRVETAGYSVVRELTGHGVGKRLHEDPFIPNFGDRQTGMRLLRGMSLAIEPIIAMGKPDIKTDDDGWTIRTKDGSLACQFEHTIIVHDTFAEIIT